MRGSVLSPDDYQRCTHICVKPALQIEGKKFVIESWINKYCAENAIIYDKSDLEKTTAMVVPNSTPPRSVVRCLYFDEEIDEEKVRCSFHDLFYYEKDLSSNIMSLAENSVEMKDKAVIQVMLRTEMGTYT